MKKIIQKIGTIILAIVGFIIFTVYMLWCAIIDGLHNLLMPKK